MYTILISLAVGIVVGGVWTLLGLWKTWAMGIVLVFVVSPIVFVILSRRLKARIEPSFLQVQKQLQAGKTALALKTLEELLPMARWQILLKSQIHAQMGSLYFTTSDHDRALEHLSKANPRMSDALLILASLHYQRGNWDKAKEVLENAIRFNKKQILPYNVYAYLLLKEGDRDGAHQQLLRALKRDKDNESTKDNLHRIENGKKLNMKRFGMAWYSLQLEKPPAAMRQQQGAMGRRGFRQPKRRRR